MHPEEEPTNQLQVGQVGYLGPLCSILRRNPLGLTPNIACNMKDSDEGEKFPTASNASKASEAHVGDTLHKVGEKIEAVEGFMLMKPMV